MTRIYLSPPEVGPEERRMLLEALDSNWIAPVGPDIDAFERELADRVGVAHAVALSSGTAALHLGLQLVGVGAGDDVLVPSFTFVATAATVKYLGANPIFVDCSSSNWAMDPELVAQELSARARRNQLPAALVTVDLYGQTADYDALTALCDTYGVPLIEDAAEALGATNGNRSAGSFGRAGVFSFNGNKIITTSGGGMLVSSSAELVDRARFLATQARDPFPHYEHSVLGYNYRLSNLLAALGRAQLRGLDSRIERRRAINGSYRAALVDVPGIQLMPVADYGEPNWWLTCILVDPDRFGADREQIRLALESVDIESRPTWKPLHLQPVFAHMPTVGGEACAHIFEHGLCLPTGSALSEGDVDRVVETILALRR
ncbi:MAG: aminotransferase class I/II-fold pyridoxal phosphate-dependent enzyme [Acidimicrobiales bacterium]